MLEVWRGILGELVAHDALVVLGKGLGAFEVTARFLAIHAAPSSLVLLINAPKAVQARLELRHRTEGLPRPAAAINNEYSGEERTELYNAGGVIAVTSRILAVDLLTERVPAEKVTGIVVWDAHRVTETSSEAFILRLFRQRNKIGFIKGISDSPESFSGGFFKVEKVMKSLFVKKLYLWPRFHVTVSGALAANPVDLVELKQNMSPSLAGVQSAVIDAIDACLVEIRKSNKVDCSELNMETVLLATFDTTVRRQLAPVWNKVGAKTKQLVEDLKTLRKLLGFVAEFDCVTLLDLLDTLRTSLKTETGHPPFWMYMAAGRLLFDRAKARVFDTVDIEGGLSNKHGEMYRGKRLCVKLEANNKWDLLKDVIAEIEETRTQVAKTAAGEGGSGAAKLGPTLVIVRDDRTASQARDVITYGTRACVNHAFRRYCYRRLDALRQQRPKCTRGGAAPAGQRWWLERDKGVELSPAQIEMRLLATRALDGDWSNLVGGGGCGRVVEQGRAACPSKAASAAVGHESGGQTGDCIVIEDDKDAHNAEKAGEGVRGTAAGEEDRADGQGRSKRVLERVVPPADDGSEEDDVPLAVKQQRLRDLKRAAGEEGDPSSSVVSRSSSASSSSSGASSVSCPSPTAMAEAAEKRGRSSGADKAGATAAAGGSKRTGNEMEPQSKKSKKQDGGGEVEESPGEGQHDAMDQDDNSAKLDQAKTRTTDSNEGVQSSGRGAGKEECQGAEGAEEGKEVKFDTESISRLLGVPREMVCGWAEGDLDVMMNHLLAYETGEMSLRELARQGVLEAFVVAAEMWEAGTPQGGFASFLEAWDAGLPQGLRHVIAHVTALPSAEQGCIKELLLGMRDLYDSCLGRRKGAEGSGDEGAAKSRVRDQADENGAVKGESSEAVCGVEKMGGKGDQGEGKEKMEQPPQLPAFRGSKAGLARGRGRGGSAKKVVDTKGGAKVGSGRGRGANKQALHTASQDMEDPNLPTRQTIKHKSELDRIFEEQCLFVSPLYAVAEGSEARVGGNTDNLPRRGGGGEVTSRGGDEAGAALYEVLPDNSVIIHTTEHVDAVLEELSPSFVVVVSPDLAVTRHLEVYKAQHPKTTVRVYYLTYSQSVEEQRYMSEVRRETEAFKTLIENKATMVVPDDQDGKSTDVVTIAPDAPRPTSTRKGGTAPVRRTKVIVDVREFRSALPSLLHSKGMNLEPLTLEVGDYILSPDICVERKSVPDLVGSFASGRLFQQAEKMTRFYKLAILLIEFDEHRPFGLQSVSSIGQDIVAGSITSKLVLLTLHFPTLRVLWMRSPHVTAQMFDELKQNQLEPDGAEAEKVGLEAEDARGQYAIVPQDILRKLPGINPNNVTYVMNHVESLHQLSTLSLDKLTALIGAANAKQLHEFLHARGPTSLAAFQDADENKEETKCP